MNKIDRVADQFEAASSERLPAADSLPIDPWDFVRLCVFTQDEHAKAKGQPYIRPLVVQDDQDTTTGSGRDAIIREQTCKSVNPSNFIGHNTDCATLPPQETDEYLRLITEHVSTENALRIEKSRQLRVTWVLAALMLHRVLVNPGTKIGYQSKKFEDGDAYLRDRFWFIYEHIPTKYIKPKARYVSGVIEVFHDSNTAIPTSQILALAEGAEQVRQYTFTVWWADEFAFQEHQEEALTAAKPTLDGGGQAILSSSAHGDQNTFYDIGYTDFVNGGESEPVQDIGIGVQRWRRNGWTSLRVHYLADVHKRGQWAAKARIGYPSTAWQQEQEIDFTIQPGQPVYCDTDKLCVRPQTYVPGWHLWRGWDFGFRYPFCVFFQVRPIYDNAGNHLKDKLYIIDELTIPESSTEQMAEVVTAHTSTNYHGATVKDNCDFYGGNQRTSRNPLTDVQILRANGITALCGPEHVKTGVEIFQKLISQGDVEIDPVKCPVGLIALRSGYCRNEDTRELPSEADKEKQHPYADWADAIRYGVQAAFHFQNLDKRGPGMRRPATMNEMQKRLNVQIPRGRAVLANVRENGVDKSYGYVQKGNVRRRESKDWSKEI